MVTTADGESVPAEDATPTAAGEQPSDEAKAAAEDRKLKAMETKARERREAEQRKQRIINRIAVVLALLTFGLAIIGVVALVRYLTN